MADYTVLLMRPSHREDRHPADAMYVATRVTVPDSDKYTESLAALQAARTEVKRSDDKDRRVMDQWDRAENPPLKLKDYAMLAVFKGHHDPVYTDCQTPFNRV